MSATPAHIRPRHDLTITEIDRPEQRLYDHNRRATGRHDGKDLAFVAVDEHQRGHGIGRALLEAAIAEARARGCQAIWALSYSFQAPGLYEKCRFKRVAELADWPPGHAHIVLRRQLDDSRC